MSGPGFCQFDAGILDENDKLTKLAKTKFIQEMKDELRFGTKGAPPQIFPCGPNVPPFPFIDLIDMEDEKKFPDLHKNIFGQYEQIAKALNSNSRFTLLPICCPVSLAVGLGLDPPKLKFPDEFLLYGFALPLLAMKLQFTLPTDLAIKLPPLLAPPIPALNIPNVNINPKLFPELLKFSAGLAGIPPKLLDVVLQMVVKMPQLATGILSFNFKPFCDVVLESKMFGDFDPSKALTWIVAQKVLAHKTAECLLINVVGTTLGSSSGGIVGGLAQFLGYQPAPIKFGVEKTPENKIIDSSKTVKNTSISRSEKEISSTAPDKLKLTYSTFLLAPELGEAKPSDLLSAHQKCSTIDNGILFARALLFRAGLTDDFFVGKYQNQSFESLREICTSKNLIENDIANSNPGNVFILQDGRTGCFIDSDRNCIISDYDKDNLGKLTAFSQKTFDSASMKISFMISAKKLNQNLGQE